MKLYQHSARCPVAMQIFLDANPRYWPFVPMTVEEAGTHEQLNYREPVIADVIDPEKMRTKSSSLKMMKEDVPEPSGGFIFSRQQLTSQVEYLHQKLDKKIPNFNIDLYNATIVALCKFSLILLKKNTFLHSCYDCLLFIYFSTRNMFTYVS